MLAALDRLEPIHAELENDAQSIRFLANDGKKSRGQPCLTGCAGGHAWFDESEPLLNPTEFFRSRQLRTVTNSNR
ncbi:hypothetical protein BW686_13745 [Pseudomonas syringae]|uniref:Uncharacterized protein n=1 Tax=Pseudomonas syringae TaxID=317 RepID=A0A244ER36_PSESX|nr:hypothetical protein BW686_13745 [Pseudomonas syringae]